MNMSDVKVGDTVFIVKQKKRRFSDQEPGFEAVIVKVGRKYATAESGAQWRQEWVFRRDSGCSYHGKDCNERANGYGFDVYHNEEEYTKHCAETAARQQLCRRLDRSFPSEIQRLPHEAIMQITAILDKHKTDITND